MRYFIALIVLLGFTGTAVAIVQSASDKDHAAKSSHQLVMTMTDADNSGPLDGFRFETEIGQSGAVPAFAETLIFDRGLFVTGERFDRCNHTPAVYHARKTMDGIAFVVRSSCPTQNASMVWHGLIQGDTVSGTITMTTSRFYVESKQVIGFSGKLTAHPTVLALAG